MEPRESGNSIEAGPHGIKLSGKDFVQIGVALLIGICSASGLYLYAHAGESRDSSKELTQATRELALAIREANCINYFPSEKEKCRELTRR